MSGTSFNSSQSNSSFQRRTLLGGLQQEVQCILEEDNINTEQRIEKLAKIVEQVELEAPRTNNNNNELYTGDCYMHSKVLKDTSALTNRCTELVTGEINNYDKYALAEHIVDYPNFWDFMFPNEVPVVSYLFGTFEPTPPEERTKVPPRRRVEKQKAANVKAPQKVETQKKPEEGSEMVEQILRFVCKHHRRAGPLSYFHVALDPTSFTRTVENIYNLSFLVKDGQISVTLDEKTGLPFISTMGEEKKRRVGGDIENQFIISMDMQRWRDLVDAFGISEPMMTLKRNER